MSTSSAHPPLLAIVGPTASGKSALGIFLAKEFGGEVVACDSTQLYRGFNIGTAKPTAAERASVTHHLLDILDPSEESTAGGYRERAIAVLNDLCARNRLPVFTVGTGLYLRALLDGLADLPLRSEEIRERLRASAKEHGAGHLHEMLARLDAQAATQILAADEQKLIRAIEICLLAQKPLSEVHRAGRTPLTGWRILKIGLQPDREALVQRIHSRTDAMLQSGWLEEVSRLIASGLPEDAKPFNFIGYRELRSHLHGELSLDAARSAIQQGTRQYAKRQLTWFRREANVNWLPGFGDDPNIQAAA
ncbi:MAG TPA: tRNA (adenosine(37)-N6)-dimethylallyltransferase MiaA, partial [Candidatus Acidoferrum sp.]